MKTVLATLVAALVAGVLAFFPPAAQAATYDEIIAHGEIVVAVYRDFPPFSWQQDGVLQGIDVDLAQAIGKRLGVRVEFMPLTAADSVDDDLRNGVWKGHYLERRVADLMMHVPVDRVFALRNPNAVIFAPYFHERLAVARDSERVNARDTIEIFRSEKVGVETATLSDMYLTGAYGGQLVSNVVHFTALAQAAQALIDGKLAAVMGPQAELDYVLGDERQRLPVGFMETPSLAKPGWDLGLAVKDSNRQLAYAIEDIMNDFRRDGTVQAIFLRHSISFRSPEDGVQ